MWAGEGVGRWVGGLVGGWVGRWRVGWVGGCFCDWSGPFWHIYVNRFDSSELYWLFRPKGTVLTQVNCFDCFDSSELFWLKWTVLKWSDYHFDWSGHSDWKGLIDCCCCCGPFSHIYMNCFDSSELFWLKWTVLNWSELFWTQVSIILTEVDIPTERDWLFVVVVFTEVETPPTPPNNPPHECASWVF